jgi:hypothetical protein
LIETVARAGEDVTGIHCLDPRIIIAQLEDSKTLERIAKRANPVFFFHMTPPHTNENKTPKHRICQGCVNYGDEAGLTGEGQGQAANGEAAQED